MNNNCGLQVITPGKCRLHGALTFDTVPELDSCGSQLFSEVDATVLDLAGVEHSDSAGLALLVSWLRLAKQQNKKIVFQNTPAQLLGLAKVSGVADILPFAATE